MKESLRRLLLGAMLLIIIVPLGCAQDRDDQPVLRVAFSLAEPEWRIFRSRVFPEFEKRNQCKIEAVQVDAADLPKLLQVGKIARKSYLDLFVQDNMALSLLVRKNLVEDLTDLEPMLPKEVYPAILQAGRFAGKLYFIPFRTNVQIFYYNREKFQKYGLDPPRSWSEWLSVARVFHQKEGQGRILLKGFGDGPTVTQMYEYIVAAGGNPFSFNDRGTKIAFAFFKELWEYASPDSRKAKWDNSNDYLAQDSVYLMQNWPFGYNILTKAYGKQGIGVYHGFPGPVREAHVIGGDVFGIPIGSKNIGLSIKFIKYLLSKQVQTLFVRLLGWPSVRSDAYDESVSPAFVAVREALRFGIFRENVPYWPEYQKLFEEAFLRLVINGEEMALLDQFHDRMKEIMAKYQSAGYGQ